MSRQEENGDHAPEPKVSEEHPELFHYTSVEALNGILKSNTLWATCATHLNDSSEMQLIWPQIEHSLTDFIEMEIKNTFPEHYSEARKLASDESSQRVRSMKDLLLGGSGKIGLGVPFVTSFTTHKEQYRSDGMLSQWRGYGGTDVVAIIFDTEQIEKMLERECKYFQYFSGCSIFNVVYYDKNKKNLLEDQFSVLFKELKLYAHNYIKCIKELSQGINKIPSMSGAGELFRAVGRVKHQAFQEENEYRIIVGVTDKAYEAYFKECNDSGEDLPFKDIHYRPGACGSVPYIRLFEEEQRKMPIKRIIVGPSRNQDANMERVRALVSELAGDREICVQRSDIPYVATA